MQSSIIMFVLAILSIYIARIFQQVLKRPISVVSDASEIDINDGAAHIEHWPGEPLSKGALK